MHSLDAQCRGKIPTEGRHYEQRTTSFQNQEVIQPNSLSNFSSPRAAWKISLFIYLNDHQLPLGLGLEPSDLPWARACGCSHVVCPPESPGAYPDPIPERPRLGSKSPSGDSDVQAGLRNPMLDKESKAQRGQVTYPRSHSKPGGDPGVWILGFTCASLLAWQSCLLHLLSA